MTTTTTKTTTRQAKAKDRSIRLEQKPADGLLGLLTIRQDGEDSGYWFAPISSDYGRAFRVEKFQPEPATYHVCIDTSKHGKADSCECKGWMRWGRCRHVLGLRALMAAGKL